MAGSSEMYSIFTRNSPGPGSGTGPSSTVKSSRVTMPLGRRASLTMRLLIGDLVMEFAGRGPHHTAARRCSQAGHCAPSPIASGVAPRGWVVWSGGREVARMKTIASRHLAGGAALALLAASAIAAPDEELLGKSAGYPVGTRANW